MTPATFEQLLSPKGQSLLAELALLQPKEADFLRIHQRFAKAHPSDLVKAGLETVMLRRKAGGKFSRAESMYFTREGLEQSSGEAISRHRAKRFGNGELVADLCCGLGGDLIGLAESHQVIGVDLDELRLAMARENLRAYERLHAAELIRHDVAEFRDPNIRGVFFDPDRRADGERHVSLAKYQPPIARVLQGFSTGFSVGIKIAPGVPHSEIEAFDAEAEFISVAGELKECVLWFGPLKTLRRRATMLPSGHAMAADNPNPQREPVPPQGFLYDPDPAIIRAGLVTNLADEIGASPIHPGIAYLTTREHRPTPWACAYAIDEVIPFHAKNLGLALKRRNVGPVTITKRGSAVNVDELRRLWKLTGSESRTVILTRGPDDRPLGIIARNVFQALI
ncbi:class I SAM-dependent methyltransferase [Zavarzinella formosa]|uniref:class I SAM-dependent methyltransferase n=1 Tax=Zavarzinella formosa TaxID=360055 RepID=UPI000309D812|nr:SAM-dependent methyltransferase [Zavarzinella formosa]